MIIGLTDHTRVTRARKTTLDMAGTTVTDVMYLTHNITIITMNLSTITMASTTTGMVMNRAVPTKTAPAVAKQATVATTSTTVAGKIW